MALGGQPETVFTAEQGEHVFLDGWQSVWSPDGKRLALLILKEQPAGRDPQFMLEIVAVEGKRIEKRFTLPQSAYSRNGGGPNWAPYNLKWSPDGRTLLLAWEQTIVFNVENGAPETILTRPSMAEWLPGNDGVYFFDVFSSQDLFVKRTGQTEPLKVVSAGQFADLGMANTALLHAPLIKLSANRSRLAIAAGNTVLAIDVPLTQVTDLAKSIKRWQADGVIVGLEWGPSGNEVAVLMVADGLTISVLDLVSGRWKILTKVGANPRGTDIDVVGLVNTLSWVP
jgi:hypothetical protein